jgi:uncharacterized protein (TIGR02145 family)
MEQNFQIHQQQTKRRFCMKALDLCKSLAASIMLAMVFTFISCSSSNDDGGNNGGGNNNGSGFSSSSLFVSTSSSSSVSYTDKGNNIASYRTVKIGDQTWMAENLNYNVEGSKCYGEEEYRAEYSTSASEIQTNCNKYGRLYNYATAMTVCPSGWHLPSYEEWQQLINYIRIDNACYSSACQGRHLKAKSGWNDYNGASGNGEDTYSFSAMPGGYGSAYGSLFGFSLIGDIGAWWMSSNPPPPYNNSMSMCMSRFDESVSLYSLYNASLGSVRCVQN